MASQSPKNEGPELSKPPDGNGEAVKGEATNDTSERPFFAPSEPMREDQVQNAVKFLSHPKVRGSPVIYRRSFLEKKGLTREEIDEAFRRVPDAPSNTTSTEAATINQAVEQPKSSTSLQAQAPSQSPQPAGVPVSNISMVPSMQQTRFHWSHALVAAGVLAASGAGTAVFFKNVVIPRLKTWIRKVVTEEKESEKADKSRVLADQTAEAAKAAATAAAVVAKTSEELLNSKNEERKYFEAFMSMMDVQVKEMKTMGEAIRKLESTRENGHSEDKMIEEYIQTNVGNGTTNNSWRTQVNQSDTTFSSAQKQVQVNGAANPDNGSVRPSSAPATVEPAGPPHPKSYMEIMAMIQRGERPPNIREIDDMPPNPNQQPSQPVLAPRPKPWEITQQNPSYTIPPQPTAETPSSGNGTNALQHDLNGNAHDSTEPWWKKKTVKITEVEHESSAGLTDPPVQRSWVPPQPPAVVIPEAAAAIRQQKSSVQNQESSENGQSSVGASEDTVIDPRTSDTVFGGSNRSEIDEVREDGIQIS